MSQDHLDGYCWQQVGAFDLIHGKVMFMSVCIYFWLHNRQNVCGRPFKWSSFSVVICYHKTVSFWISSLDWAWVALFMLALFFPREEAKGNSAQTFWHLSEITGWVQVGAVDLCTPLMLKGFLSRVPTLPVYSPLLARARLWCIDWIPAECIPNLGFIFDSFWHQCSVSALFESHMHKRRKWNLLTADLVTPEIFSPLKIPNTVWFQLFIEAKSLFFFQPAYVWIS